MKNKIIASLAALFLASLPAAQAQTTIAQWTFENLSITNYSPNPTPSLDNSAGAVSVAALGMTNWMTPAYGTNDPDVVQGAGSDSSSAANGGDLITNLTRTWRVRAQTAGNGWSSLAPVGTQGAQFNVDTTGFTNVQVGFDWYLTKAGEANIQLQYTADGINWSNLPITIPTAQSGSSLNFVDNTSGLDTNSVQGYYVHCVASTGGQQWFTNLTATITNTAVANNTNFGIRMVNASTGTACVNGTGTALNNTSGNWRFDNIIVTGSRLPQTIAQWTFENLAIASYVPNPAPSLNNSVGGVSVAALGMTNWMTPAYGTNDPDVLLGVASDSSTAPNGGDGITNLTHVWRVRAQVAGNGWSSQAPVGTQGAQFNVDTTAFTNVQVGFDWYLTKAGEANLQLQYTTDGINWSNTPITIPAAQAGSSLQFVDNTAGSDANSVQGYYVNCMPTTGGQQWFTNLTATITNTAANNNPNFGIRMVNASTGTSCLNGTGTALNNTSGNWRFDNITVVGQSSGAVLTAPGITPSAVATVDGQFTLTFTDSPNWRNSISLITVNGLTLSSSAYQISAGQIVFTPAMSALLQKSASINIAIDATNYSPDLITQFISPGAPKSLVISGQPAAPTGNGGTLVEQPALAVFDQYNNAATNCTATYTATASSGWAFGPGSGITQTLTNGAVAFTNLSATSAGAVSGATITFTASGATGLGSLPFTTTNSAAFNIPAPATTGFTPGNLAVEQEDVASKNSTFSILELSPTIPNQSIPVNIFPVTATGTNAMRQSSSGSTGRLAESDDGTLLCFSAAVLGDSTVADATTIDPRGGGTFNYQGNYVLQTTYIGLGEAAANQARSSVTVDDITFFMGDKGGVYTNNTTTANAYIPYSVNNPANVRSLKSYGGTVYALQQEGGSDPTSTVMAILPAPAGSGQTPIPGAPVNGSTSLFPLEGFPLDGTVLDFSMLRSSNNGAIYDTVYYIDGTNTTSGAIFKYYYTGSIDPVTDQQVWASTGNSWPTANGGDGLTVVTNVNGGFDLYYTTGSGGSAGNSVVMVHDSAAWNQPINLTSTNILYTVGAQATLKGIAIAPAAPPGVLTAATLTASNVTAGSATLGASIIPGSATTAYWFQYGLTTSYGGVTTTNSLAASSNAVAVASQLTGLTPGTVYHYQIVATNSTTGLVSGGDQTFTTLSILPTQLTGSLLTGGSPGFVGFNFTNVTGASFSVRATNNINAPLATWPVLGTAVENPAGSGHYQFTSPIPATNNQMFYILHQP